VVVGGKLVNCRYFYHPGRESMTGSEIGTYGFTDSDRPSDCYRD
jgi:hypothetical protein